MLLRSRYYASPKPIPRDFPIALDMRYQVLGEPQAQLREARTLRISSREIIFHTGQTLPVGADLEITIAWPARLGDRVDLQLRMQAHVLHTLSDGITAEIRKYEFRTCGVARAAGASETGAGHAAKLVAQGS
jgi:hypothetical protein